MSIGIFTDKNHQPDISEIYDALGNKKISWQDFIKFLSDNISAKVEYKFYGKNYGWALAFKKGAKAIASLYPQYNCFTVLVILKEEDILKALSSGIGARTRQIINDANPYREGRWIFIPIKSKRELEDAKYLIKLKLNKFNAMV